MKHPPSTSIEKAIKADDWAGARKLINRELRRTPNDHWLLTRLALTFYEQRQYGRALWLDAKALQIAPYCPLAIWGYAGTLDMLGREGEALKLYRWITSWGEEELAYGEYLSKRRQGHRSIYSLRDVKTQYKNLWNKKPKQGLARAICVRPALKTGKHSARYSE